ncbi:hypothetical protein COCC4DRAFT_178928 [Bipolaris maydis ATCC 48331]|uniref:F-box domain-containing protein n=2 Tax=Cochliobolus heterostrophus TaxID=5016 RepID=M2V6J7_COCH5|nr:uncharacterized protein COCC4DRAFT_178928 [Bipolaris maydis ATCC 48331]EMD95343.1 hypothetical protein COCHEDRAFT_1222466 [Bipolaris maydis C5]KAJ5021950.1 hypothetical protein J3E73DRAFT_219826 [Bipolaris maydis]ENI00490.1 hypothetical protein COCC4DRAFT_178928 [Bipolaris maydis ATCC 48331]KAJ5055120.1 hypothetical protein J3E74DRAFT_469239 [Bipolaris maydis]KAJ6191830.1 hypothetical protein J3E72DRAFT_229725 [Bipolaris maydis]
MAPSTPSSSRMRKRRVGSPGITPAIPNLPRETTRRETASIHEQQRFDHQSNTVLDYGEAYKRARICLLDLPSELIDLIASKLRKEKAIFKFALVSKRLSGIVQQTMVRKPVLRQPNIRSFLEMLGHHPELIQKITHVDLGDFDCSHHQDCHCRDVPNLDGDVKETIGRIITANTQGDVTWSHIRKTKSFLGPVWREDQAFFLNTLVALCSNMRSITIELPGARRFQAGQPPRPNHSAPHTFPSLNPELLPVTPFDGIALQILRPRLQSLIIAEDTRWKGPATLEVLHFRDLNWRNMGKHTITLAGFSSLKRLDVPMDALGCPQNVVFSNQDRQTTPAKNDTPTNNLVLKDGRLQTLEEARLKVLPSTLTHLHLRSCNKFTFAFLKMINETATENMQLRYVELFFHNESHEAIINCDATDEGGFSYLDLLMDLERKHINVQFFCGARETRVDMRRELEALSFLTPFEVWRYSNFRRPFSELSLCASSIRQSSMIGSRLFLRHANSHSRLFNSSTFHPESWAQSAFFRGTNPTKKSNSTRDQKPKADEEVDTSHIRNREKQKIRRRLPDLLSLDSFQFSFNKVQSLSSLPGEVVFQGVVLPISTDSRAHPIEDSGSSKKSSNIGKDEASRTKRGRRTRYVEPNISEVKILENNMVELEIGSGCRIITPEPPTSETSTFNIASWVTVDWRVFFKPSEMNDRMII